MTIVNIWTWFASLHIKYLSIYLDRPTDHQTSAPVAKQSKVAYCITLRWFQSSLGASNFPGAVCRLSASLSLAVIAFPCANIRAGKGNPVDTGVTVLVKASSLCRLCVC